jgi:hypothetical protein
MARARTSLRKYTGEEEALQGPTAQIRMGRDRCSFGGGAAQLDTRVKVPLIARVESRL